MICYKCNIFLTLWILFTFFNKFCTIKMEVYDMATVHIESNYDDEMLEHGKYPYVLKRRVRGDRGHLSNEQAHDFIINSKLSNKTIYLIHVSENNNSIEKLNEMVSTLPVDNRYIICERGKSYWE